MRGSCLFMAGVVAVLASSGRVEAQEEPPPRGDVIDPLAPEPGAPPVAPHRLAPAANPDAPPEPPPAGETPPVPDEPAPAPPKEEPSTLLGWTPVGKAYDDAVAWKDERIPLQIGGWHWYHIRQSGPIRSEYGIPGLRGTYYYQLRFYPEFETTSPDFTKVGAYVDFRLRDDTDQLRAFYESNYWLWEAYGWVETPVGRLKAGKVWKRFGLDWDGCWWGNAPYFDGHKLDPDWGISLESSMELEGDFTLDTFVQYFFRDDRVNGSLAGADAEGIRRSRERDTAVVRLVPGVAFGDLKLSLGLSGTVGRLLNSRRPGATRGVDDAVVGAVAADLTVAYGPFKAFGEVSQGWGVITPSHYVSGGPSNKRATGLVGAHYVLGPATLRATWSTGWDDNPAGWQSLLVTGVTLAVTKNVDIYAEYVHWEVHGVSGDRYSLFENGYQLILNWRF